MSEAGTAVQRARQALAPLSGGAPLHPQPWPNCPCCLLSCRSNSPGGVNFESAPFKLTRELLEVLDSDSEGRASELFDYFKVCSNVVFCYGCGCVGEKVVCAHSPAHPAAQATC